jgi:hypothetical protein
MADALAVVAENLSDASRRDRTIQSLGSSFGGRPGTLHDCGLAGNERFSPEVSASATSTASASARFTPSPPNGDIRCAASPKRVMPSLLAHEYPMGSA